MFEVFPIVWDNIIILDSGKHSHIDILTKIQYIYALLFGLIPLTFIPTHIL